MGEPVDPIVRGFERVRAEQMRRLYESSVTFGASEQRDLPHVGLGGPARSMYGERSTIGEAQRAAQAFAKLSEALASHLDRSPIKVTASVGPALGCEIEGCGIHARQG